MNASKYRFCYNEMADILSGVIALRFGGQHAGFIDASRQ